MPSIPEAKGIFKVKPCCVIGRAESQLDGQLLTGTQHRSLRFRGTLSDKFLAMSVSHCLLAFSG